MHFLVIIFRDMKGCICHFRKWQIYPFISKRTYIHFVLLDIKGCICHLRKWQIHPFIYKRTYIHFVLLDMKGCICHFLKWQIHPFISKKKIGFWTMTSWFWKRHEGTFTQVRRAVRIEKRQASPFCLILFLGAGVHMWTDTNKKTIKIM